MPGTPTPGRMAFPELLADLERRIRALETQQQQVITDPTGATGDPARGHAIVVIGSLQIVGLTGYGIASFKSGAWLKL